MCHLRQLLQGDLRRNPGAASSTPERVLKGLDWVWGGKVPAAQGRGGIDESIDDRPTDRPMDLSIKYGEAESSSQVKIMCCNVRSQGLTHLPSLPAPARLPGLPSPASPGGVRPRLSAGAPLSSGELSPSFNQEPAARRGSPDPPAVHTCPPTGLHQPAQSFRLSGPKSESPWPLLTAHTHLRANAGDSYFRT